MSTVQPLTNPDPEQTPSSRTVQRPASTWSSETWSSDQPELSVAVTDFENKPRGQKTTAWPSRDLQPRLDQGQGRKYVDGAVTAILSDGVLFTCQVGDREVTIQLPTSIVPPDCRHYGQTVRISLRVDSGVRFPTVEYRAVPDRTPDKFSQEFRSWMETR